MLLSCCTIDNINSRLFDIYTTTEEVGLSFIFYLFYKLVQDPSNSNRSSIENLIYFMMDKNIHPDIKEMKVSYGNTILHNACMCKYSETIAKLFDTMCKKMDVNCLNKESLSPLYYACRNSQDWMMFHLFQDSENNAIKSLLDMEGSLGIICCNSQGKQCYVVAQGAANVFNLPSVVGVGIRNSLLIGIVVLGNSAVGKNTLICTLKMMITDNRQQYTAVTEPTTGIMKEEFISF